MRGVHPVAVLFERRPRRVERLRRPAQIARDERDLGLGDDTPRAGHGLFRTEGARRTSHESLRSNEIAELGHRDAAKCQRRRVVAQGDPVQCAEGVTRRERTRRGRDQRVHRNPATLVTPTVRCPVLIYLTTTNQHVVSRERRTMTRHMTGTREEWLAARLELLEAEKELTRRSDELARRRQKLPWVRVDKEYRFETDQGSASLADLFRGRSQLLVYHFMFGPDYTAGCPSCSMIADGFDGFVVHLANHDVTLSAVSRAPLAKLQAYKRRMGWTFPWASSLGSDFNYDFNVSITQEQQREGVVEYNYRRRSHAMVATPVPEPVAQFAAMCGTDAPTYTRDRPGMSALRGCVGSAHGRELGDGLRDRCRDHRVAAAPVVVFDDPLALLLLGDRDVEVVVEVAAERGRPRKPPPHPPLIRLQRRERRPRHRRKRDVVVRQVDDEAVEPVRDHRAGRTPRRVVGPEHEVVDEELRAPSEEVCQRCAPLIGLESVLLVDPDPRQLLTSPRQLVAAPR